MNRAGAVSGVWLLSVTVGDAFLVGALAVSKLITFTPLLTAAQNTTWTTHRRCVSGVTPARLTPNVDGAASCQGYRLKP